MTATDFEESNWKIGENQPEYETLPVFMDFENDNVPVTMCFKLNEEELKQVKETGKIWVTILTFGKPFSPIGPSLIKPEGFK